MPVLTRDSSGYLPIEGYAAIGNGRTVALVGCDVSLDWCCLPHLDSPILLGRLLDARSGGFFSVAPSQDMTVQRRYLDQTNVLETVFRGAAGCARLLDFMPLETSCIVRHLEVLEGCIDLRAHFDGSRGRSWRIGEDPCILRADTSCGSVSVRGPAPWEPGSDGTWESAVTLSAGSRVSWILTLEADEEERRVEANGPRLVSETVERWKCWSSEIQYDGPYRDAIVRSALALKMLVFEPTGALAAAATTSLPEEIGGTRNWDYRFAWLRDSALVLDAFMALGLHAEALKFWEWIERLGIRERNALRIMYTLDGSNHLPERVLEEYEGYKGSRPVRIGNAASQQIQLDAYGYILDAAYVCQTKMRQPHPALAPLLRHLADEATTKWQQPDQGIWEMRGPPRHFLHSKLMCWVALDRAVRLAEREWLTGSVELWRSARDDVRKAILEQGYNAQHDYFSQSFGDAELDASALTIPLVGFLPGTDARVRNTIAAVRRELARGESFMMRYTGDDELGGEEGAFIICSFWLVQALALAGERAEATELFERLLERSNDVGLLAEEIDPATGAFLGNFPQAFSHLALIHAALALKHLER